MNHQSMIRQRAVDRWLGPEGLGLQAKKRPILNIVYKVHLQKIMPICQQQQTTTSPSPFSPPLEPYAASPLSLKILPHLPPRHLHHPFILHRRRHLHLPLKPPLHAHLHQLPQHPPQRLPTPRLRNHALPHQHPPQRRNTPNLLPHLPLHLAHELLTRHRPIRVRLARQRDKREG